MTCPDRQRVGPQRLSLATYAFGQLYALRVAATPGLTPAQFKAQLRAEITAIENHANVAKQKGKK